MKVFKKNQNIFIKFFGPLFKTLGVCTAAYLVLCIINAYSPKNQQRYKSPVKKTDK